MKCRCFWIFIVLFFTITTSAQQSRISGTVYDKQKNVPLPGASISIPSLEITRHTDNDGGFAIEGIAAGTYTLTISATSYTPYEQTIALETGGNRTIDIYLTSDQNNRHIKPKKRGNAGIRGTVYDSLDNSPVPGVHIFVKEAKAETFSDANGTFFIRGIAHGKYELQYNATSYHPKTYKKFTLHDSTKVKVHLTPKISNRTMDVAANDEFGSIRGAVLNNANGAPLAGAKIVIPALDKGIYSNENGTFMLTGIPPGSYTVWSEHAGFDTSKIAGVVVSAHDSRVYMNIKLQPSASLKNIGLIEGIIRDSETSNPVSKATVLIEGTPYETVSDTAGIFRFEGIPSDTHTIVTLAPDYAAHVVRLTRIDTSLTISLSPDTASDAAFKDMVSEYRKNTAPKTATISGVVSETEGSFPIANGTISLDNNKRTSTRADGTFAFDSIPPGIRSLSATAPGYDTVLISDIALTAGIPVTKNIQLTLRDSTKRPKTCRIYGTITDKESSNPVVGARIIVDKTKVETMSDLNGTYRLAGLKPGTYKFVFIQQGYATKEINDITLTNSQTLHLDVTLEKDTVEVFRRFMVTSTAKKNTQAGLLKERQKSISFSDAIGAMEMSQAGAGNAADAMKSVPGVTVVGGKYIVVRGLPEHYTRTVLNGSPLPSPDPDKQAVNMDLFPSGVLENIVIYKTFTPNLPGDFAGGVIDVKTKPFPEKFIFSISSSGGFNPGVTGENKYWTYEGGKMDWLGIDDGSRAMPEIIDRYSPKEIAEFSTYRTLEHSSGATRDRIQRTESRFLDTLVLIDSINNAVSTDFKPFRKNVPLDQGYSVSIGNVYPFGKRSFGFRLNGNYKQGYNTTTDNLYRNYGFFGPDTQYTIEEDFVNLESKQSINWSILGTSAFRISENHILKSNYLYTKKTSDKVKMFTGKFSYYSTDSTTDYHFQRLRFSERSINFIQLTGEHRLDLPLQPVVINWNSSHSKTDQYEPDMRQINFFISRENENEAPQYKLLANVGEPSHQWRTMKENATYGDLNFAFPFYQWNDDSSTISLGTAYFKKQRIRRERKLEYLLFEYYSKARQPEINPTEFIIPENAGLIKDTATHSGYSNGLFLNDNSDPAAQWKGNMEVLAFYGMVELPLWGPLSAITGLRYEHAHLLGKSFGKDVGTISDDSLGLAGLNDHDILPMVSFTYKLQENMQLRAAYGKTLIRPSMRQKADYKEEEFSGGPSFRGNPTVERYFIDNFDLRWEWFTNPGELISASTFYKIIHNPIEITFLDNDVRSVENMDAALTGDMVKSKSDVNLFGVELELRKRVELPASSGNFLFASNITLSRSLVPLFDLDTAKGIKSQTKKNGIYFPNETDTRPFQGQSPYVLNLFVVYDNENLGFDASLSFNYFAERLSELTSPETPWIWEKSRPEIHLTLSKTTSRGLGMKVGLKNIMGGKKEYVHHHVVKKSDMHNNNKKQMIVREELPETSPRAISIGISYEF